MRTVEEAIKEFQRRCVVIHLFQEVLDVVRVVVKLVGADALLVTLVVAAFLVDQTAEVLGEHEGRIVARRQHQPVEQLLGR